MPQAAEHRTPTHFATVVFQAKAHCLQLKRDIQNVSDRLTPFSCLPGSEIVFHYPIVIAESRTPLYTESHLAERGLQLGKVQNLRCAVRHLHGMVLPAGEMFSFWMQIGKATRQRGYVPGRQLQEGCLFPAIGGGLCQLSNALYDLALQANGKIIERHPHTRAVPGSAAEQGRDATVAWNYIDLRFLFGVPTCLEATLTHDALILRLRARKTSEAEKADFQEPVMTADGTPFSPRV